eukprot:gnl/TRDRNA2_/TRDRNA2_86289_c0_seq1.p1 gnl/TRDRNA2_/TRDRNA2_86289_c0~~gnl/TRDRNA2_/TRDRNA2_86289_c0_seq1.p1  ORF type:complete len:267 (+),score=14.75 gnl/TRDRNA2_/TRDRNA2_86289_c0_seq1:169-969(+)
MATQHCIERKAKLRKVMLLTIVAHLLAIRLGSANTLKWLPLGDSITFGCNPCSGDRAGFRIPTASMLAQEGLKVETVGSLSTGPSGTPAQWLSHEGHPSWRTEQIEHVAQRWTAFKPDFITIQLGNNDCYTYLSPTPVIQNLTALLNTTFRLLPKVKVFLTSNIRSGNPGDNGHACVDDLGTWGIKVVFDAFKDRHDVVYVPMYERTKGLCGIGGEAGLCTGGIHPTGAGYLWMASILAQSIHTHYCQSGDPGTCKFLSGAETILP